MIPNRIFVALFGLTLLGVAVANLLESPIHWGGVILPALGGLWLTNLALARRRFGHHRGICGPAPASPPGATGS